MKKYIIPFALLTFLLVPSQSAFAQDTTTAIEVTTEKTPTKKLKTVQQNVGERKEARQERKDKRIANRCEKVTQRIANRITRFEENKQSHIDRYNNLETRLTDIANKLEAKGYDVESFRTHLKELDTMVQQYASEYAAFIDLLIQTKDFACGESEGAFKDSVKAARDQLKVARGTRRNIREFYRTVIREDIKNLRNQTPTSDTN